MYYRIAIAADTEDGIVSKTPINSSVNCFIYIVWRIVLKTTFEYKSDKFHSGYKLMLISR